MVELEKTGGNTTACSLSMVDLGSRLPAAQAKIISVFNHEQREQICGHEARGLHSMQLLGLGALANDGPSGLALLRYSEA